MQDIKISKVTKYTSIVLAILAFLAFTSIDVIVKVLTPYYTALFIGTYLRVFSTLIIFAVLFFQACYKLRKKQSFLSPFKIQHPYSHLTRGLLLSIISLGFTHGFSLLPLNTGYAIVFLLPLVTALFGIVFLKEHISPIGVVATIGGFLGVLIILRPGIVPFSLGYISLFLGVLAEAPFFILIRRYHKNDNFFNVVFYPSVIASILLILIMYFTQTPFVLENYLHLIYLLLGGLLYLVAQVFLVFSLSKITAHTSIAMQYTQIIWGTLFGVFLFRDTSFDLFYIIGIIVIIACSYIVATQGEASLEKKM